MYNPTLRLLTILELLQNRDEITGSELAERLEINGRSVRRYITMLQDLGIPVESLRGRYGSYRLKPGYNLPPLMFTNEEAVAVTLGLLTIERQGFTFAAPSLASATAKISRVLPLALRERLEILKQVLVFNPGGVAPKSTVSGEIILRMAEAVYRHHQLKLQYRNERGEATERVVDPYGLALWTGRWYMVGYCHMRSEVRAFRLDRVREVTSLEETYDPPAAFDCEEYLAHSFGRFVHRWEVEVILKTSLAEAQAKIGAMYGTTQAVPEGVLYRCRVDNLAEAARFLVELRVPFQVVKPPELRTALRDLASEIIQYAQELV